MPNTSRSDTVKIIIKLDEEKNILLKNGKFTALNEDDVTGINDLLCQDPERRVYPLFGSSSEINQGTSTREEDVELGRFYVIEIHDMHKAEELAHALNAMRLVEEAYVEPPTHLAI